MGVIVKPRPETQDPKQKIEKSFHNFIITFVEIIEDFSSGISLERTPFGENISVLLYREILFY